MISLSQDLDELLARYYSEVEINEIKKGYQIKRVSTLRVNTLKTTKDEVISVLKNNNIVYEELTSIPNALIASEIEIKKLPLYNDGKVYFQSLSSMMPPLILNPKMESDILDMSAAPGSKTTQIAALTLNCASIMAVEINKVRMERLKYNVMKQGAKNVTFMLLDARKLDDYFSFDQILLDAPCSGSGTINFNDESIKKFSKQLVYNSSNLQKQLIDKAIKILKVGGTLVYSTCSVLPIENEEVVKYALRNKNVELVPLDKEEYAYLPMLKNKLEGTITVLPNEYYEGFFIAKIRKIK